MAAEVVVLASAVTAVVVGRVAVAVLVTILNSAGAHRTLDTRVGTPTFAALVHEAAIRTREAMYA